MNPILIETLRVLRGLWIQFEQIAPFWALGLVAGSLINIYLSDKIVAKVSMLRGGGFNIAALCLSAALGIASPLCMYGTAPLIASLGRKRVPEYLLAAFMVCSILLNPNLFIMSFALGADVAVLRLCISLLGGLLAGSFVYVFCRGKPLFRLDAFEQGADKGKSVFWLDLLKALRITSPYLFIGILLTALYDLYFPKELMTALFAGNQAMGTLFAMSLSIPLYTCGGGSIPLLLAWMREGMSVGSALAFMIAGPATKFTSLGAVKIILGAKNFALYLLYCLGFAMASGIIADLVLRLITNA